MLPVVPILLGVATAVGAPIAVQIAYSAIDSQRKKDRLTRALLVDCVATIHKFKGARQGSGLLGGMQQKLTTYANRERPEGENWIKTAKCFNAGYVVSPPLDEFKQLIPLVSPDKAACLVHYYDRWARFADHERRYVLAVNQLLEAASRGEDEQILQEYFVRILGHLRMMRKAGRELVELSFTLFHEFGPKRKVWIADICDNRWQTWQEMEAERRDFQGRKRSAS